MFIWTKLNYFSNINFISPWRQQTQNTQTYKKVQKFKKCFSQKFLKQDIDKITVSIGSFSESEFIIRLFRRTYVNFNNIFGCILGDIAKKWFRINIAVTVLCSVSVCLFVLSVCPIHALCWNGRRYRHDFFAYNSPVSLPDCVKFGLHWSTHSSPNFAPVTNPSWFDHRGHSMANCGRMVAESAMVTIAYSKPTS